MQASVLLDNITQPIEVRGEIDCEISSIVNDSRKATSGCMFAAVPGVKQDGATYAEEAVSRGAALILTSKPLSVNVPQVIVTDVRKALGEVVSAFYGHPSRSMLMIGVTGTNGKTTVTYYLEKILTLAGINTGLLGTIEMRYANKRIPSTHTSPDSPLLQRVLKEMSDCGVSACVMELSSHALTLDRPAGSWFDGVGITNITHDHLDFHETWEAYRDSKLKAFELLKQKPNTFVVANQHDQSFQAVQGLWKERLFSFGFTPPAQIRLIHSKPLGAGNEISIQTPTGAITARTKLPGAYNIANALTATALAYAAGIDLKSISQGLSMLDSVPGRFEVVRGERYTGVVDFAHNPDGLLQLLLTARNITKGKIILVFGCQGEKDMYKRPIMGEIAARWADEAILTTDDWFNEDPRTIFGMIMGGYRRVRADGPIVIWRRDDAIFEAVARAQPDDLIIVSGRGPERKLIMGKLIFDFDDAEFLKFCIAQKEQRE